MNKSSLYASLPVGTLVFLETYYVAPSGEWAYCEATVKEDLGESITVEVPPKEASSRRVVQEFTILKSRIREIIS